MRRWMAFFLLALLPGLPGCDLSFVTGHSFLDMHGAQPRLTLGLSGYGRMSSCSVKSDGPLATLTCAHRLTGEGGEGSENDIESIFSVAGPLLALLAIFDPLIIQVPAGYSEVTGNYDLDQKPLAVQSGLTSVEVQPGVFLTAEPGHELVIVDFPAGPLDMSIPFELFIAKPAAGGTPAPVDVKVMVTAKITVDGKPYYLPVLPCVTDFAKIPPITLPPSPVGQDLLSQILTGLQQSATRGCQNVTYAFSTTTTTLPAAETCDNCADDDGDGLVDFDDPQCCGGGSGALTLARTQFAPRKTGSRVTLGGGLGQVGGFGTGPSPDVQIQVREDGGKTLWCAHVPSARLKGKKLSRRFRDRGGALAGLQELQLRGRKSDGSVKLVARAKQAALQTPKPGSVGVTVGLWGAGASPATARCLAAVETFRTHKKGAVRFP